MLDKRRPCGRHEREAVGQPLDTTLLACEEDAATFTSKRGDLLELATKKAHKNSHWFFCSTVLCTRRWLVGAYYIILQSANQMGPYLPNPYNGLPLRFSAYTTSIAVMVLRLACSAYVTASRMMSSRNTFSTPFTSPYIIPEMRLTPPLRASLLIACLVMPSMLSRRTRRWRLAPPFPSPLPPFPRPDMMMSLLSV